MQNQTISRKDLHTIYSSGKICEGWKTKISNLLLDQQLNDDIIISESLLKEAYAVADTGQKKLLEKYFEVDSLKDIKSKVKDFNDILKLSGKTLEEILPYKRPKNKKQKFQNGFAKLQLIEEVLNNGHVFNFGNISEYKYFPYFQYKARGGWVFSNYYVRDGSSDGEPAYFTSSELATFVGQTFINEYKEYLDRY